MCNDADRYIVVALARSVKSTQSAKDEAVTRFLGSTAKSTTHIVVVAVNRKLACPSVHILSASPSSSYLDRQLVIFRFDALKPFFKPPTASTIIRP